MQGLGHAHVVGCFCMSGLWKHTEGGPPISLVCLMLLLIPHDMFGLAKEATSEALPSFEDGSLFDVESCWSPVVCPPGCSSSDAALFGFFHVLKGFNS